MPDAPTPTTDAEDPPMIALIDRLKTLSSAEDFLQFFGLPYEEKVVHVNRLHILKRFYQYLHRANDLAGLDEVALFRRYRELLAQAYQDFVASTPAREKVFRVFQDADGTRSVDVTQLRSSLVARRSDPAAA